MFFFADGVTPPLHWDFEVLTSVNAFPLRIVREGGGNSACMKRLGQRTTAGENESNRLEDDNCSQTNETD